MQEEEEVAVVEAEMWKFEGRSEVCCLSVMYTGKCYEHARNYYLHANFFRM
jgi:hypothetical protein